MVELLAEPLPGAPVPLFGQLRTPPVVEGSRSQWFGRGYDVYVAAHPVGPMLRFAQLEARHPGGEQRDRIHGDGDRTPRRGGPWCRHGGAEIDLVRTETFG